MQNEWQPWLETIQFVDPQKAFSAHPTITPLVQVDCLRVAGPDAVSFLQGQLTCDVTALTDDTLSLGACCDQKGRMQANFWIWREQDACYLLLPATMLEILTAHLKKYAVFSQVQIERATPNLCVFGLQHPTDDTPNDAFSEPDWRFFSISTHRALLIVPHDQLNAAWQTATLNRQPVDTPIWNRWDIEAGLTFLYPETSGQFLPQMINWDVLGGVSYKKGCYLGQEIVARTHYLGKLKRHLYRTSLVSTTPVQVGDPILTDTQSIAGIVTCSAACDQHYRISAVLQDGLVDQALSVHGHPCTDWERV